MHFSVGFGFFKQRTKCQLVKICKNRCITLHANTPTYTHLFILLWPQSNQTVHWKTVISSLLSHLTLLDVWGNTLTFGWENGSTRWMFADIWLCITSWRSPFSKWQVMVIYLSQSLIRKFTNQNHLLVFLKSVIHLKSPFQLALRCP